jgi:hypothetical protein
MRAIVRKKNSLTSIKLQTQGTYLAKPRKGKEVTLFVHHRSFYTIYTISQQMHCSDSLLVFYSSYMFRHMYVIIREPSCMCPAELH